MEKQQATKTSPKFRKNDAVWLHCEWDKDQPRFIQTRTWSDEHGWVYKVGRIKGVGHREGIATVQEKSLSKR